MLYNMIGGASGLVLIGMATVVLAKTHGPEFSLPALVGMLGEVAGATALGCAIQGDFSAWASLPLAAVTIGAVWAVLGRPRHSHAVKRTTGFGDLDEAPPTRSQ